jgi:hypothetical protein
VAARGFSFGSSFQARLLAAVASGVVLAGGASSCGGQSETTGDESQGGAGDSSGSGGVTSTGGVPSTGGATTGGVPSTGGVTTGGVPSTGGATSTGGMPSAGGTTPVCTVGTFGRECFTLEQLEAIVNNPSPGGDVPFPDAGMRPHIEVTDCLPYTQVMNGCCNPAISGPDREGERCCYEFCVGACCGRPFVSGGGARLAEVAPRSDWLSRSPGGDAAELERETALALRAAWLDDARGEHASVASFARFTLELLGLGAPAELVLDAQRAALDEIEHTRLCFAVVARISGETLGPGPLDASDAAPRRSLAACAAAAVREGCVGETIAAAIASAELDRARDPAARRALERIAADEARHAEASYRFVAWALATGSADVKRAVRLAFEQALGEPAFGASDMPPGVDLDAWHRFGRLTPSERRDVARATLCDVIGPCAARLAELG